MVLFVVLVIAFVVVRLISHGRKRQYHVCTCVLCLVVHNGSQCFERDSIMNDLDVMVF